MKNIIMLIFIVNLFNPCYASSNCTGNLTKYLDAYMGITVENSFNKSDAKCAVQYLKSISTKSNNDKFQSIVFVLFYTPLDGEFLGMVRDIIQKDENLRQKLVTEFSQLNRGTEINKKRVAWVKEFLSSIEPNK